MSDAPSGRLSSPFDATRLATWQRQELLAILRPLAKVIPLRVASNERAIERSKRKMAELEAAFLRGYKPRIIVPKGFDDHRDLRGPVRDSEELEQYREDRRKSEWQEQAMQAIAEIRGLKRPDYDALAIHVEHVTKKFPYRDCPPFKPRADEYIESESEALRVLLSLIDDITTQPTEKLKRKAREPLDSHESADPISKDNTARRETTKSSDATGSACASAQETSTPHPDGPEAPHWMWLTGIRHRIESPQAWKLLNFFWNRDAATFDELSGPEPGKIWPDPVQDSALTSAANRFQNAMPSGFPFKLRVKNRTLYREPVT
jgi:hypothetical protein